MSPLERMLYDMRARAHADPFFDTIGLYVMRPRSKDDGTVDPDNSSYAVIEERVNDAINCTRLKAGKGGAAVTFLMPQGDTEKPNLSGPQMRFTYTARVQEHPILNFGPNGTRKSAEEIALHTLQLFHLCMFNGGNCLSADTATLTPSDQFAPKLTYDVRFVAQGNLPAPAKVALPVITPRAGGVPQSVAIACATADAQIFYTVDGSYPSGRNPAARPYRAPLDLTHALTLRAAAEKAGLQQSDIAQATFS